MPFSIRTGELEGDARAVGLFIVYLKELPLKAWIDATTQRPLVKGMADAEMALRVIVRQLDHHANVFATRDAVRDALDRFECAEGRHLTRPRYATAHLRPATENAALGVLLRRSLSPEQFAALYAPFEPVIPSTLLFGLSPTPLEES